MNLAPTIHVGLTSRQREHRNFRLVLDRRNRVAPRGWPARLVTMAPATSSRPRASRPAPCRTRGSRRGRPTTTASSRGGDPPPEPPPGWRTTERVAALALAIVEGAPPPTDAISAIRRATREAALMASATDVARELRTRGASRAQTVIGLTWLSMHPGSLPAPTKAFSAASSTLGAASASLARAGTSLSGARS